MKLADAIRPACAFDRSTPSTMAGRMGVYTNRPMPSAEASASIPPRATAIGLLPTGIFAALMVESPSLGTSWILALGRSEDFHAHPGKKAGREAIPSIAN